MTIADFLKFAITEYPIASFILILILFLSIGSIGTKR